jgi:hypothetical protein
MFLTWFDAVFWRFGRILSLIDRKMMTYTILTLNLPGQNIARLRLRSA